MIMNYRPSEDTINEINQAVRCLKCNGDISSFSAKKLEICENICHEMGITNPTDRDKLIALSMINTYIAYALEEYLEEKYHGNSVKQGSEPCCSESN